MAEAQALLLESLGHEVMIAHDGHAALELGKSHLPDVSLLDIGHGWPSGSPYAMPKAGRSGPSFSSLSRASS